MSFCFVITLFSQGCAKGLPLPGGDERINEDFYESDEDMLEKLGQIKRGMTYAEVFEVLGHPQNELIILSRAEIIQALYGSSDIQVAHPSLEDMGNGTGFLQSLYGYKFNYRVIDKEHGLSSPIRLRTREHGYSYSVTLIFRGGRLFENPIVSGGVVEGSSSSTVFDYLNPGNVTSLVLQ
jgi:hypothetical protein